MQTKITTTVITENPSDPLKFSWDPLDQGFAGLKVSGKSKLDPLKFCASANPALNLYIYVNPCMGTGIIPFSIVK